MLLEVGESWMPDGLYAPESHTLENEEGTLIFEDLLFFYQHYNLLGCASAEYLSPEVCSD